jgi:hypothetical protein
MQALEPQFEGIGVTVTCVDVFLKDQLPALVASLNSSLGRVVEQTQSTGSPGSRTLTWKPENFVTVKEAIVRDPGVGTNDTGRETIRRFLMDLAAYAVESDQSPYALLVVRAKVSPDILAVTAHGSLAMSLVGGSVATFVKNLGGLSAHQVPKVVKVPTITVIVGKMSEGFVAEYAARIREFGSRPAGTTGSAASYDVAGSMRWLRENLPISIDAPAPEGIRSYFLLPGNLVVVTGQAGPAGFDGMRDNPYMVVLSSFDMPAQWAGFDLPAPTSLPPTPELVAFLGPDVFAVPLALRIWTDYLSSRLDGVEQDLVRARSSGRNRSSRARSSAALDSLVESGEKIGAIELGVGALLRRTRPSIERWLNSGRDSTKEIGPISAGNVSVLLGETIDGLTGLADRSSNLSREVTSLLTYYSAVTQAYLARMIVILTGAVVGATIVAILVEVLLAGYR